jgi:hypothetical protein
VKTVCVEGVPVARPADQPGGGGSTPTSTLDLVLYAMDFALAAEFNAAWHSTLPALGTGAVKAPGRRFLCYAACARGPIYGRVFAVAIWSKPAGRMAVQDGSVLELRRLAIGPDAPRNTASRMLRVMALLIRKARPQVRKLTSSHTTTDHTGAIYKAAGWVKVGKPRTNGTRGEWAARTRKRPPAQRTGKKQRWEKVLT